MYVDGSEVQADVRFPGEEAADSRMYVGNHL